MLKVGCLMFDTELANSLKNLVEYAGYNRISKGMDASVGSIYNEIRKAGIEVDLQTIGHLYNEVLPKTYKQIMSDEEVNEYALKNYTDAIQRASLLEDKEGEQQIGQYAPELHLVNGLLNMFTNANTSDQRTKSDMLTMQNALWKGIQRKLSLPDNQQPKTKEQWKDILGKALGYQQLGIRDLNGRLNSISDLYNAMKQELATAQKDLYNKGNFAAAAKFDEMVKQLQASTYSLLFSKGEAKDLLDEMMKEAGFAKTLKDGTTIKDWNKLAGGIGSVQDIRNNVERVLRDNGYNADVIEGVKNSLANEFQELQAETIHQQEVNKARIAREGATDIIDKAVKKFLGGKTMAEWVKDGNIETVEQLEDEVFNELKDKNYQPGVRNEIIQKFKDFFNSNYAKVESKEAQNAIESLGINAPSAFQKQAAKPATTKTGKTALQWIKDNGIQNKQELFDALDKQLDARVISPAIMKNIKAEFARILDLDNKAETDLKNREKAIDREVTSKTDLKRLAELNNLGIFQTSHDRLLHNLIGVSDLQQEDIADLKELAQAASDLYRHIDKNYGNDIYGSSAFQSLQRNIDSIITRNINNKTRLNKIISAIKNFFDVYLTGLLIAPFTIIENLYSGVKEIVAPLISGNRTLSKEDLSVWWNVLKDVTSRGQSFGEEVGSFAPRELYSNTLKYRYDPNNKVKSIAEGVLHTLMMPARIGLLGLDSANKAVITNKTFHNAIYKALTQKGMSHDEATKFMNEALHGQSFQQAKDAAKEVLEKTNKTLSDKFKIPVNNATITRLANDLVKANLNTNKLLYTAVKDQEAISANDLIEAALKSSYHVAGLGLGHEPNNPVSEAVKGMRDKAAKKEQRLIKERKWDELAVARAKNTAVNAFGVKFLGGATNWLWLRVQSGLGMGIATGLIGNWKGDIDFRSRDAVEQSIKDIQNARNKIGRGLTGLSFTAMAYLLQFLLAKKDPDEEEKIKRLAQLKELQKEGYLNQYQKTNLTTQQKLSIKDKMAAEQKKLESETNIYQRIKANYEGNRLFKKVAPDLMLLQYYYNTDNDNAFTMALDYTVNQLGIGDPYSVGSKVADARDLNRRGDSEAAAGVLASVAGGSFGVPLWNGYKEYNKLGQWIGGKDVSSSYKQPTEFWEGMVGGGMLEDFGFYNRDSKITNLPGIGGKTYEIFKEKGIERMNDLKEHPNWYDMKYRNESGNIVFIMDATSRKKAKEAADKWFEQQ